MIEFDAIVTEDAQAEDAQATPQVTEATEIARDDIALITDELISANQANQHQSIGNLEARIKELTKQLAEASQSGDVVKVVSLSREVVEAHGKIQALKTEATNLAQKATLIGFIREMREKFGMSFNRLYFQEGEKHTEYPEGQPEMTVISPPMILLDSEVDVKFAKPRARKQATQATSDSGKGHKRLYTDGQVTLSASELLHQNMNKLPKAIHDKVTYADEHPGSRTWSRYAEDAISQGALPGWRAVTVSEGV